MITKEMLQAQRKKLKLSQQEIALISGYSRITILNIENGNCGLLEKINRLLDAYAIHTSLENNQSALQDENDLLRAENEYLKTKINVYERKLNAES